MKKKILKKHPLTFFSSAEAQESLTPLFLAPIQAGFPSPADDYIEKSLDLNEFLIEHPAATFFVRVQGHSMRHAQIFDGDLLIVDRAIAPKSGQIVVAILNGEFTVKRILVKKKELYLVPENFDSKP